MFNRKAFEWKHYLIYWGYNYKENYDRIFAGVLRFLTLIELGVCILVPNSIIYPQNRAGKPVINPSGKYMIKLRINGVSRKVNLRCMYLAIFYNPRIIFSFLITCKNSVLCSLFEGHWLSLTYCCRSWYKICTWKKVVTCLVSAVRKIEKSDCHTRNRTPHCPFPRSDAIPLKVVRKVHRWQHSYIPLDEYRRKQCVHR